MRRSQVLLAAVVLLLVLLAEDIDAKKKGSKKRKGRSKVMFNPGSQVRVINYTDWDDVVTDVEGLWLVMFYLGNCQHCHEMAGTWEGLAEAVTGLASVAAVSCDNPVNEMLCKIYGREGYPGISVFPAGLGHEKNAFLYRYARDPESLIELVMGNVPRYMPLLPSAHFDKFLAAEPRLPKCFYVADNPVLDVRLNALAFQNRRRIAFAQISANETDILKRLKVFEPPQLLCLPGKSDLAQLRRFEGDIVFPKFFPWVLQYALETAIESSGTTKEFYAPLLPEQTNDGFFEVVPEEFASAVEQADTPSLVQFCHRWMRNCEASKLLLPEVAKGTQLSTFWVDLDLRDGHELFEKLNIQRVPTTAWFPGNGGQPLVYQGENNAPDVVEWVNEIDSRRMPGPDEL